VVDALSREPLGKLNGRVHEYTTLAFLPSTQPFNLFDSDRNGRIKLYVKRVFITDDANILPRYLRFVRGLVDAADLPLNISHEMIEESRFMPPLPPNSGSFSPTKRIQRSRKSIDCIRLGLHKRSINDGSHCICRDLLRRA
jgi:hypothetical protein